MTSTFIARIIFTVAQRASGWAVELDGQDLETFQTREEALASATKRANASQNAGAPARIHFAGETMFALK
jgi:hypothetical protein